MSLEINAHLQLAKELGQLEKKPAPGGPGGGHAIARNNQTFKESLAINQYVSAHLKEKSNEEMNEERWKGVCVCARMTFLRGARSACAWQQRSQPRVAFSAHSRASVRLLLFSCMRPPSRVCVLAAACVQAFAMPLLPGGRLER